MTTTVSPLAYMQPILDYAIPITGDRDGRTAGDAIQLGGDYSPGKCTVRRPSEPRRWDKRTGYGWSGATLVYMGDDLAEFEVDVYLWTQPQANDWNTFHDKWLAKPNRKPALGPTSTSAQAKAQALAAQQSINEAAAGLNSPGLTAQERESREEQITAAQRSLDAQTNGGQSFLFPPQPKALGIVHPKLARAKITAVVVTNLIGPDEDDFGGVIYTISFEQWNPPIFMLGRPDGVIPAAKKPTPTASDATEKLIQETMAQIKAANDNLARGQK